MGCHPPVKVSTCIHHFPTNSNHIEFVIYPILYHHSTTKFHGKSLLLMIKSLWAFTFWSVASYRSAILWAPACGRDDSRPPSHLHILRDDNFRHRFRHWLMVSIQKAIEHGRRNRGFTHWKWWFSIAMLVYQRVIDGEWLVGGRPTPLKNMKVSWDKNSQYMGK